MNILKKIWYWFIKDEGMTWENYHRNMAQKTIRKRDEYYGRKSK